MNVAPYPPIAPHNNVGRITLGMAQLAPRGLSEEWWLKHLGDVHWRLIADAVGQNTTVFRDRSGRQLYAAFCATEFTQSHPEHAELGQAVEVHSSLWSAGRSRIQSNHRLFVKGIEIARFRLVSTFVSHKEANVNASVRRATPYLVPVLAPAPDDFANQTASLAKRERQSGTGNVDGVPLSTMVGADFNAVGLLYFPSFTRLFEQTELGFSKGQPWSPVQNRLVLYFGNIEQGETIFGTKLGATAERLALNRFCPAANAMRKIAFAQIARF